MGCTKRGCGSVALVGAEHAVCVGCIRVAAAPRSAGQVYGLKTLVAYAATVLAAFGSICTELNARAGVTEPY